MKKGKPDWWDSAVNQLSQDPSIGKIVRKFKDEHLIGRGDIFQTLVRSIVGQQISVIAADSIHSKLVTKCGDINRKAISALTIDELASCGLTRPKCQYIQGIASSNIPLLPKNYEEMSDSELISHLTQFRGIGPWTAEMMLIFSLMRKDILSLGDLGVVKGIQKIVPEAKTKTQLEKVADAWKPYRSAACWFLWRSLDPVPVEY